MKSKKKRLIDKLDKVFSHYIRIRDRISNDQSMCVTCGAIHNWKGSNKLDCGHFQSRRHLSTRWHEKNASAQCVRCNRYGSGEQYKFGLAIDSKYGKGTADHLFVLSKRVVKYSEWELQALIDDYKSRIEKELKKMNTSLEFKI